jgi:Concanavalin A-like lectin/glucanases superfamily
MWRTVAIKEQRNQLAYALYAGNGRGRPSGHVYTTRDLDAAGASALPLNAWRHLASTWDGRTLRLYVDGTQVASRSLSGRAVASGAPLQFGGNTVWREWFKGVIDEVRIYSRALTQAELRADRLAAIGAAVTVQSLRTVESATKRSRAAAKRAKSRARKVRARVHRATRRR